MAGNKLKFVTKIKASTILEVVVSMAVIILVFGIAMTIYLNVIRNSLSVKKIKAEAILQDLVIKAQQTNSSGKQTIVIDDYTVDEEIKPSLLGDSLTEVHCIIYDSNQQKVAELFKILK